MQRFCSIAGGAARSTAGCPFDSRGQCDGNSLSGSRNTPGLHYASSISLRSKARALPPYWHPAHPVGQPSIVLFEAPARGASHGGGACVTTKMWHFSTARLARGLMQGACAGVLRDDQRHRTQR